LTTEYAINTQRLALIRLLAGWEVVIGVMSLPIFSGAVARRVLGFVSSLLSRAELAAGYLVVATVQNLSARGVITVAGFKTKAQTDAMAARLFGAVHEPEASLTVREVQRRIWALRRILANLPRAALRLLRKLSKDGRAHKADAPYCSTPVDGAMAKAALRQDRRVERPPDKQRAHLF
jgi:hypothetical protein